MLICIFARSTLITMTLQLPPGAGIGDEQVADSAPYVRAQMVQRLEILWRTLLPHIDIPLDEDGHPQWKADPRFLESAIRVIDRMARLYRLDQPQPTMSEVDSGSLVDKRVLAANQLAELESRMRPEG